MQGKDVMKIFLTGNQGRVGSVIEADLLHDGHEVVGYDRLNGQDILDIVKLETTLRGCEAIIHTAALVGGAGDSPYETMQVNVQGTWNVLMTAKKADVKQIVYFSSVNALGIFRGGRKPDYLPIDDEHPCYPSRPYGMSKRLAEEMCRLWSASTGIRIICLRPPAVWTPDIYEKIQAARKVRPSSEWEPYWEYGAFIDVRDLSAAAIQALSCPMKGFTCLLVSSSDISTSGKSSQELAQFIHPDVEWRGGEEFREDPFRSLVTIDNARKVLNWEPQHTWRSCIDNQVYRKKP